MTGALKSAFRKILYAQSVLVTREETEPCVQSQNLTTAGVAEHEGEVVQVECCDGHIQTLQEEQQARMRSNV